MDNLTIQQHLKAANDLMELAASSKVELSATMEEALCVYHNALDRAYYDNLQSNPPLEELRAFTMNVFIDYLKKRLSVSDEFEIANDTDCAVMQFLSKIRRQR
jgi:hypothetical protein